MSNAKEIILVTGGAGFVGSHLVERLLKDEKNEVHVFDVIPLEKAANLANVKNNPRLKYFMGDLRKPQDIEEWYRPEAKVIYHLASIVGIKHYIENPLALIDIVVGGTRTLLDLACKHKTKFIFSSTSEIYGKNPAIPWDETGDRVLGPTSVDRWSYSSAKAVCEHMIYAVGRAFDLQFVILRFFNVYGPRQNPIFVVSQSVEKVLKNESPLIYDGGKSTRCFTYIDDIIDGVIESACNPKALGQAINLGNNVETSVKEVINTIISEAKSNVEPKDFITEKEYGEQYEDIIRRVPQVSHAKEILNWQAKIQIKEGIAKIIQYEKNKNN